MLLDDVADESVPSYCDVVNLSADPTTVSMESPACRGRGTRVNEGPGNLNYGLGVR